MSRIPVLVRKLQRDSDADRASGAEELFNLAVSKPSSCAAIARAGGVPTLVRLLCLTDSRMLCMTAAALANVGKGSPERIEAIAAAGGIELLVRLLDSSDGTVWRAAVTASC